MPKKGATNFPWDIDEALRRRLEKRIYIPLPNETARLALLQICLSELKLSDDVNLAEIAAKLDGYSGADITNVCRDASMEGIRKMMQVMSVDELQQMASRGGGDELNNLPITMQDFHNVLKRVAGSVSKADLEKYEEWMKEYGST